MFDVARAFFYVALSSEGDPKNSAVAQCMNTVENIFVTYLSPTPMEDYQKFSGQNCHLAKVHQVLIDTTLLKLQCLLSVKKDVQQA